LQKSPEIPEIGTRISKGSFRQQTQRFQQAELLVLTRSRHQWVSIEGEIKKWVELNWAKREKEQPEWFTDANKAFVPVEFIPQDGDARRRESVRRASVDAEAENSLAGALSASIRRASVGGAAVRVSKGVGGG
jgi:hypothetical protein